MALYKAVSSLVRAYASIANEMAEAGYTEAEARAIRAEVVHFEAVREEVKTASGDYVDMKMYEPAMRHLLDSYVRASDSEVVSTFDEVGLVELLANEGEAALIKAVPEGIRKSKEAMAETIENNIRRVIIDEQPVNPRYFDKMSALLDALIKERKTQALEYKSYLQRLVELAKKVKQPSSSSAYPSTLNTSPLRALYDNLDQDEGLALRIDTAVRHTREDAWRGHRFKERKLCNAIARELGGDDAKVDQIFELVKSQRDY
ncbi:MAG: hypothetical protein M3418_02160 [Gemmatimonadota bacterium]|nr:hypothetical protein [Gemmatimonadota bacterium]